MAILHQGKKQPNLNGFDFGIADLVDQKAINAAVLFKHFVLGMIGYRAIKLFDKFNKQDEASAIPLADSVGGNEKGSGPFYKKLFSRISENRGN